MVVAVADMLSPNGARSASGHISRTNLITKVLDIVKLGGPTWTVGRTIFEMRMGLRG